MKPLIEIQPQYHLHPLLLKLQTKLVSLLWFPKKVCYYIYCLNFWPWNNNETIFCARLPYFHPLLIFAIPFFFSIGVDWAKFSFLLISRNDNSTAVRIWHRNQQSHWNSDLELPRPPNLLRGTRKNYLWSERMLFGSTVWFLTFLGSRCQP